MKAGAAPLARTGRAAASALGALVVGTAAWSQGQPLTSPAATADATLPVRVVCVADTPEAFLRDATFRDRVLARLPAALPGAEGSDATARLRALIAPLGKRYIVPVGSGFVVDPERRHVVSSWHAVTACSSDRTGGSGREVGVIEVQGADIVAVVGERLPARTFQDAGGKPVKLVQSVCRDKRETCGADLPRSPDDRPMPEAERARQLANLVAYAPDLAVLRLKSAVQMPPLPLALNQQLDDQMRLVLRTFGPLPVGTTAADAAARLHLVAPVSVAAVYTGPQALAYMPLGGQPEDEVHLRLHRLSAAVQPGHTGAAVMRGGGVVGVLTALQELPDGRGAVGGAGTPAPGTTAYAVPVTVVASFLDLLKVAYVTKVPESLGGAQPAAVAALPPPAAAEEGGLDAQRLMMIGALALALLAAAAFFLLSRRKPPRSAAMPGPADAGVATRTMSSQRTVSRVNPTLLHAVAMPTSALDLDSAPQRLEDAETIPGRLRGAAQAAAQARLHCSSGPLAPSVYALPMPNGGTTLFVGRDAQACQVVFPPTADQVSGSHACFTWDLQQHRLTLRDLSSSGTWINGQRIAKGRTLVLASGDRVDLGGPGSNRFTVELPGPGAG